MNNIGEFIWYWRELWIVLFVMWLVLEGPVIIGRFYVERKARRLARANQRKQRLMD